MPDLRIRTPLRITPEIEKLCRGIDSRHKARFVPVEPERDSVVNECFYSVRSKVQREGGDLQCGWAIWEWPRVFLEAEFHGVWVSREGKVVDVTRRGDGELRILFLPDSERKFDFDRPEERVPTVYMPLADDPTVREYLALSKEFFALKKKYAVGRMSWPAKGEALPLMARLAELEQELLSRPVGRNDPCPCGSGKKYKQCCMHKGR